MSTVITRILTYSVYVEIYVIQEEGPTLRLINRSEQ
jgi:hypothetical protein